MRTVTVIPAEWDQGMTHTQMTTDQLVALLRHAEQAWQRAAEYGTRGLWHDSGTQQAIASMDIEQVIEELQQRGL